MPIPFSFVCSTYHKVEGTTKRLEIIDLLSDMFARLAKAKGGLDDLDKVVYLTLGRLYPDWKEQPKLGVAQKNAIQLLSSFCGLPVEEVKKIVIKKGDLGSAAYYLLHPQSPVKIRKRSSLDKFLSRDSEKKKKTLTVSNLYSQLDRVARASGPGSQKTKIEVLLALLDACSAVEAKYLLRIVTSTMRLGVGEMAVLDALTQAFLGDKEKRPQIERAYNLHPDMGRVALLLATKGLEGVRDLGIQLNVPVKMMLASRLPHDQILAKLGGQCVSEFKLDGERLQVHKDGDHVELFSRRLIRVTEQYPDVADLARDQLAADVAIVEGEVVAMDDKFEKMLPFQVLSRRRRKFDVERVAKAVPVALFLFDALLVGDKPLVDLPFPERRAELERIVRETPQFKLVPSRLVKTHEELVEFFKFARESGTEGTVNKSMAEDSRYEAGNRGFSWVKLKSLELGKMADTVDAVVVGAYWGSGRRQGVFGTFLLATYDPATDKFESLTKVGTGFNDQDLESLTKVLLPLKLETKPPNVTCSTQTPDVWLEPRVVFEISGDELTKSPSFDAAKGLDGESGYSVRFPTFERVREDKSPHDVTTSSELLDLYEKEWGPAEGTGEDASQ
ncbi:MAG: ATP-dependent DNA ligase [Promethearchaeota archaeon]